MIAAVVVWVLNRPVFLWLGLIALAALCGYVGGRIEQRSVGRIEQLQEAADAARQREDIDNDVSDLGRDRLCIELGGLPNDCAALRRPDKAAPAQ